MRLQLTILTASLGTLLLLHGMAGAQTIQPFGNMGPNGPYGPMSRPVLSPYLNMIGGPANNFYNQTNMQFDQRAFDQRMLQQAPATLAPPPPDLDDLIPRLPQTGHLVGFQYQAPYFGQGINQRGSYFPYNPGMNTGGTGMMGVGATGSPAAPGRNMMPGAGPIRLR